MTDIPRTDMAENSSSESEDEEGDTDNILELLTLFQSHAEESDFDGFEPSD